MAKKMDTLDELYTDLLKDLYSAEKQIAKALPKMAKAAQSPDLQKAFNEHLKQTERQAERIEKIFSDLNGSPRGKKCVGMEGLIKEGDETMKSTDCRGPKSGTLRDIQLWDCPNLGAENGPR
jgi:ferritin-like metal-binding protein YciE